MEQLEYKIDSFRGLIDANKLNQFGLNRWNLIQIIIREDGLFTYIFSRTINNG